MESTDKPPVTKASKGKGTVVEFLPDADEIERRPLPRLVQATLHLMMLTLITFLLWASFSEVDQVVVAPGSLVTPLPNIVVQPLETAIILSLDVRPGQVVKKGGRLATLDPTFTQADESSLRTRLGSLDTQSQHLREEIAGKRSVARPRSNADSQLQSQLASERLANYQAQLTKMEENIARLRATIETNGRDQQILAARMKSVLEIETMQEKLVAQQFGARVRLLEAQDKRLEVERDLLLARNREQELKRELAGSEAEKAAFEKSWRQRTMEDLLSTSRTRDEVKEQLAKADKRQQLVTLVSPVDAVVLDMAKLSQGSVARGGETLFTLVPLAAELEAEVRIGAADVGYVKTGDPVHIKVDTFPFQRHGSLKGEVRTISEDAFRRDSSGQGVDAYYMSRIKYGDSSLRQMPEKARLLPGMTVSAEIVVGKRSVMSYLIWPLTKAVVESIREP